MSAVATNQTPMFILSFVFQLMFGEVRGNFRTIRMADEVLKSFKCEICHFKTKYSGNLTKHVKKTHEICEHVCKLCEKVFAYKSVLRQHDKSVHGKVKQVRKALSERHRLAI